MRESRAFLRPQVRRQLELPQALPSPRMGTTPKPSFPLRILPVCPNLLPARASQFLFPGPPWIWRI